MVRPTQWCGANRDIYANRVTAAGGVTSVGPEPRAIALRVLAPLPNPSAGAVALRFTLSAAAPVTARVFGVDGRAIRTLVDARPFAAGTSTIRWDGADRSGRRVASGIYLSVIEANGVTEVRRFSIVR